MWLITALVQIERNGALLGVHGLVRPKDLDSADIVRDGDITSGEVMVVRLGEQTVIIWIEQNVWRF